jgi:SAM-dependent methyltransferase
MTSAPDFKPIHCPGCGASHSFVTRYRDETAYEGDAPMTVVSCEACGLVFLNPQPTEEAYSEFYASSYYGNLSPKQLERNRAELARAYLRHYDDLLARFAEPITPETTLLDVGSGHGTWLTLLARFAKQLDWRRVTALEPSRLACEALQRLRPDLNIVGDMLSSCRLPAGAFDAVMCGALIEHLTDPLDGLAAISRLLKPRGTLLLATPSLEPRSLRYGYSRFFKFVHTIYFTRETLESMLQKSGFQATYCRVDPGYDVSMLWCPTILLIARKTAPVERPAQHATARNRANAAATAALFVDNPDSSKRLSAWRRMMLKASRAAYLATSPRL